MGHRPVVAAVFITAAIAVLSGHASIGPAESKLGASERYTLRVPTEGDVATVGVDLAVPDGVTVSYVQASGGWTSELRRDGTRIVGISWKVQIPPAHFGEFAFNARNPKDGTALIWKVTQRFADGSASEWIPSTKLVAATWE